ncbi:hypothetical protein FALBO_4789 [Fusarium albosuccineum]|uniref:Uncharacterized protein n=1 Tax=Fusarium albosuccineum TaxID=1237068 RepID=A0A8H4LGG4_9HYPO|nr:hypothetical protein FALBO_4789 [Fusarium albosuccineum]
MASQDTTETVDRYKKSQHPWVRKFRDSIKNGQPQWLFYLGSLHVYGRESDLPRGMLVDLQDWVNQKTPEDEGKSEKEQAREGHRRIGMLDSARSMALELGHATGNNPTPTSEAKVCMTLQFLPPATTKKGHAPGNRKGASYKKRTNTEVDEEEEEDDDDGKPAKKRTRTTGPASDTKAAAKLKQRLAGTEKKVVKKPIKKPASKSVESSPDSLATVDEQETADNMDELLAEVLSPIDE